VRKLERQLRNRRRAADRRKRAAQRDQRQKFDSEAMENPRPSRSERLVEPHLLPDAVDERLVGQALGRRQGVGEKAVEHLIMITRRHIESSTFRGISTWPGRPPS
jgi:hypothetical protein